jgi:hypothetical protein
MTPKKISNTLTPCAKGHSIDDVDKNGEIFKGTPLERERLRVVQLEEDLQLAQNEIVRQLRVITGLKNLLSDKQDKDPKAVAVKAVGKYYEVRMGVSKRWKYGDKRQKAVLARLREGRTAEELCRAIDGLAHGAYTNPDSGMRYDDLELVMRNEVNLEKFHRLAQVNNVPTLIGPVWRSVFEGTDVEDEILSKEDLTVPDFDATLVMRAINQPAPRKDVD